jgi:tetratricopeptide (TPR) repeat protein
MKPTRHAKPRQQSVATRDDGSPVAWGALIVLLAVLVYLPTLRNGFIWDDETYVEENLALRSLDGLRGIWFELGVVPQYYPLVHSTFWVEYHLWGVRPIGYHAVNMLLHAASAVLLWRLLVRLGLPGAWLAGALFAVHPVHIESVAWITERKNVLSCLLALGAIAAYLRFAPPEQPSGTRGRPARDWAFYGLALLLYVGALWSKTVTASVPAVLLVIRWWKQGRLGLRDAVPLAPFFVIGLALSGITVWMERANVGATGDEWDFSPVERMLIAGRALWFYAGKLLWPHPLIFFYPRWTIDDHLGWQYVYPAGVGLTIVALWLLRHRWGRGPLAAVLIFAGVLLPALGFFNVYPFRYSFVADHFQYHASIGFIALFAAGLVQAARRLPAPIAWLGPAGAGLLLAVLAVVATRKTFVYFNAQTVYEDTVMLNPRSWAAHNNLGNALHDQGKYRQAIAHFEAALAVTPNPGATAAHASWGTALVELGERDEAREHFRQSLALARPGEQWRGLIGLGGCAQSEQRYDEAIAHYQKSLETLPPRFSWAPRMNLALCLAAKQRFADAVVQYRKALAIRPNEPGCLQLLGQGLLQLNQPQQAVGPLRAALRARPQSVSLRVDLAKALLKTEQISPAVELLHEAVRLEPHEAETHNLLGAALAQQGDLTAAIAEFETALGVDPEHAGAANNLRQARELHREASSGKSRRGSP